MENNNFSNDSNGYNPNMNNYSGNNSEGYNTDGFNSGSFYKNKNNPGGYGPNGFNSNANNSDGYYPGRSTPGDFNSIDNYLRDYKSEEYSFKNSTSDGLNPKNDSNKIKILILLVIIVIGIYVVYPIAKKYIDDKNNTFYVTVQVERVFQPGDYGNGTYFAHVTQPVMKCKVISINRNNYQKTHTIVGEPKVNDVLYLTEIHGDSYEQFTQFEITIKGDEIQGGQFVKYIGNLESEELYNNQIINETSTEDTSSFSVSKEESETYLQDLRDWIPDEQEESIQAYLEEKYSETGIRMYIIFFDTNDDTYMDDYSKALINSKSGQAITYSRNANDSSWHMWWIASTDEKNEYINSHYTKVGDAYLINGTYEERLRNVIDTAYGLYE